MLRLGRAWDGAHTNMRTGNFGLAKRWLWYIILRTGAAAAFNRLGIIYVKQGRLRLGTLAIKVTSRIEPTAASYHNLALVYYQRKKYEKARLYFQESLAIEPKNANRYIALAKTEEQLGNSKKVLENLQKAGKLRNDKDIKKIFLIALKEHKAGTSLSPEVVEALGYNRIPWQYKALDNFQEYLDQTRMSLDLLERILKRLSKKKLSKRTKRSYEMSLIFFHNASACQTLLVQNYSHAALVVCRSIVELYLKTIYALSFPSFRGYAMLDNYSYRNKINANKRILGPSILTVKERSALENENTRLKSQLDALNKTYRSLDIAPSVRQIAIYMDGARSSHACIELYGHVYERGSNMTHLDSKIVKRITRLSGTTHGGLFNDSHDLIKLLNELLLEFVSEICQLPEITAAQKKEYLRAVAKVRATAA